MLNALNTIDIHSEKLQFNKHLIKKIKDKLNGNYFHFFYEPRLIVRVEKKNNKKITDYLLRRKLKYKIYPYPFVKDKQKGWSANKKQYGVGKNSVDVKYYFFHYYYGLLADLALTRKKKDDTLILDRITHCWANMFGYEWLEETKLLLKMAIGRLTLVKKYDIKSGVRVYWCDLILLFLRLGLKMITLLV